MTNLGDPGSGGPKNPNLIIPESISDHLGDHKPAVQNPGRVVELLEDMYVEDETYIACEQDFSDLDHKVEYVLSNFDELQTYLTENFRKRLIDIYNPIHLVKHTYELLLQNLQGVESE